MNREEIIKLAQEAEFPAANYPSLVSDNDWKALERFAALVAAAERERTIEIIQSMKVELEAKFEKTYMEGVVAGASAEREACAKVCSDLHIEGENDTGLAADIIRARGQA